MDKLMKTAMRGMLVLMAISMLLWAVVPEWKTIALGLFCGFVASALNAFLLQRRIGMVTEAAVLEGTKTKRRGLGFGNRIAMVLLLAMIGYRYPDIINLPAALAGSMVMPFLLLVAGIFHTIQENRNGKG